MLSFRSKPAVKAFSPAAQSRITLVSGSASALQIALPKPSTNSRFSALRTLGRFSMTLPTLPTRSYTNTSSLMTITPFHIFIVTMQFAVALFFKSVGGSAHPAANEGEVLISSSELDLWAVCKDSRSQRRPERGESGTPKRTEAVRRRTYKGPRRTRRPQKQ